MGNRSSSRPVRSSNLSLDETDSSNRSANKPRDSSDDDVTGHLISFNAKLEKGDTNNEYTLPKGSHFYFDPDKPDECIIVCLVCSFKIMSHHRTNLEKKNAKTILEKLLLDKGIADVGVCVLVTENHTDETSDSRDITLKVRIPTNVTGHGVTEHDVMTILADHLNPEGYKICSLELIGTLVSSGLVTLKKSETENIKLIPKGTRFTFYDYELSQLLFLMTIEKDYRLSHHAHDSLSEMDYYTSQTDTKFGGNEDIIPLVIKVSYFFKEDLVGRYGEKLKAKEIAKYLTGEMQNNHISVITNFETDAEYHPAALLGLQTPLLVGVHVWLLVGERQDVRVPNAVKHLGQYFSPNFKVLPQVPAPGLIWPPNYQSVIPTMTANSAEKSEPE